MSQTFDTRKRHAPRPAPIAREAVSLSATPPAKTFASLAARLHGGAPARLSEADAPMRAFPGDRPAVHPPVQRRAGAASLDFSGIQGPGRPRPQVGALPASLRANVEGRSGRPMDDVRVHWNSVRPAQLGALAYAQGRDIHLGPGQERHLPHEAWHVVQQAQGRVRPTRQLQSGIAVNDDPVLEQEADTMDTGAFRDAEAPKRAAGPTTRSAWTEHSFSTIQRVEYPEDSVDTINKYWSFGDQQVTGAMLQYDILNVARELFKSMPEGTPYGLRLGSYVMSEDGALSSKAGSEKGGPHEEEHGMPYLTEEQRAQLPQEKIKQLIEGTLRDAQQWTYLMNPKNRSIFETHQVVIDVDCQFDRAGVVGFHKDSRGTTAFVNLTFSNNDKMTGTEYYEDLDGDSGQEQQLPEEVRKDIGIRRELAKGKKDKSEIRGGPLPAYGRISFSDPNLYHSSPLMGNRYGSKYLNSQSSWKTVSKSVMIDFILQNDNKYSKNQWEKADNDVVKNWYGYYMTNLYHGHGLEKNSALLGTANALADAAGKRNRRMSVDLTDDKRRAEVETELSQARTFIRTWVRFVKRT